MGWYQYNTASIWDNIKNGESHWRYISNKKLQVALKMGQILLTFIESSAFKARLEQAEVLKS